VNTHCR